MKRTLIALGLLALAIPLFALAQSGQREARRDISAPRLVAHEWGVWLIHEGQVTLQALADESPPFVIRAQNATTSMPPAPTTMRPQLSRKPVLFLRSNAPIDDLQIEVRFTGGQPWLLFPSGQVTGNRIFWRGSLHSDSNRGRRRAPAPPAVSGGHWWSDLRAVNADTFSSTLGGAERFIFYDGPVRFRSPVRTSPLRARRGTQTVWMIEGSQVVEHRATQRGSQTVRTGNARDLRTWLMAATTSAGLTSAEARALLETWSGELFGSGPRRMVYMIPRASYDRMLPLRITPTPAELVRVGLGIEHL